MADDPTEPAVEGVEAGTASSVPEDAGEIDVRADEPPATGPSAVVAPLPHTGYTPAGVPTLEGVREKIENRLGTALAATELAEETPEGRTATEQYDEMKKAAAAKLDQIRASMDKPGQD